MHTIRQKTAVAISLLSLLALVAAPIVFAMGGLSLEAQKQVIFAGTVAWFVTAPWWMKAS